MEERVYSGTQFQRESMEARKVGSRRKKQRDHTLIHTKEGKRKNSQWAEGQMLPR